MSDVKLAPAITRLARLVLDGDVVFFIGAGFSIDSERNSARRLMRRLIIRLLAFVECGIGDAANLFADFLAKFHLDPGELLSRAHDQRAARVIWLTVDGVRRGGANEPGPDATFAIDDLDVDACLERLHTDADTRHRLRYLIRALGEWPINRLARDYYEVNEWFCLAYESLLAKLVAEDLPRLAEHEEQIRRQMNEILSARADAPGSSREIEPAPLQPVRSWFLHAPARFDARLAGKALFLETVGFADLRIMGGALDDPDPHEVATSFHGRLLPRHHVLARFAREGWCPTVITTNFDRLLEGAYRLAGFRYGERARQGTGPNEASFPDTLISSYDVVASAHEFCRKAKAFRTAVVVKIHGCADRYRRLAEAYSAADPNDAHTTLRAELEDCVRSLVFTYREIQHWRSDDWAADYLRTILRTRTVVFCGYSVRDPVIHDTFRGAFEEMSRLGVGRALNGGPSALDPDERRGRAAKAPLFVITSAGERAFHSEAVLHAATEAIGERASYLEGHPNRIDFHFRGGAFPDLDEVFRWLQHLTWRERQRECVENNLARTAALLGSQRHVRESGGFRQMRRGQITSVQTDFAALVDDEKQLELDARQPVARSRTNRRAFADSVGWTERFHSGLLREFACAEDSRRLTLPNVQVAAIRRHEWYFPVMENAVWTCWSAVVELALRAAASALGCDISVADCARPTVLFHASRGGRPRTPYALTIEFAGAERAAAAPAIVGAPAQRMVWELKPEDVPWPIDDQQLVVRQDRRGSRFTTYGDPPPGSLLWACAAHDPDACVAMRRFLRGLDEYMHTASERNAGESHA